MALLVQDFGTRKGLHIWAELEDDSLQENDQTRLLLFAKNENRKITVNSVEIRLSIHPEGPTIVPEPVKIQKIVPGRTIRETLAIIIGDSKKNKYELTMVADFQLAPANWELGALPFQVQ